MPNFGRVWTGEKGDFFAICKKMGNFGASCDWFTPRYDVRSYFEGNMYMYSSTPRFHTPRRLPWRRSRFSGGGLLIVVNDNWYDYVAIGILFHLNGN